MKFKKSTNQLFTDNGVFIKKVSCPLEDAGAYLEVNEVTKCTLCNKCHKEVVDINNLTDKEVLNIFEKDSETCVSFNISKEVNVGRDDLFIVGYRRDGKHNTEDLVNISTARNVNEINKAVKDGYNVVLKITDEQKNSLFSSGYKYSLIKTESGKYIEYVDPRVEYRIGEKFETIISHKTYNDTSSRIHYAAYIVPKNLKVGDRVFLEDIIEDFPYHIHHGSSKLKSWTAIFNGKDFDIDYKILEDSIMYIG